MSVAAVWRVLQAVNIAFSVCEFNDGVNLEYYYIITYMN